MGLDALLDSSKYIVMYSGPCILRPPIDRAKHGLKLKAVLKWIYIENFSDSDESLYCYNVANIKS